MHFSLSFAKSFQIHAKSMKIHENLWKVIKIYTALQAVIATANGGITFEIGGTAITGGGITVAYSGSAVGDVDSATPTAANDVLEGGTIEMITDGASTNAIVLYVTFVIRR